MSLLLALAPVSAHATTGQEAITFANAQRAANGIPPLTLNQSLLRPYCSYENHEIAAPGSDGWAQTTSPWDAGPRHKSILYSPLATSAAYAVYPYFGQTESEATLGEWQCMWFSWNWEAVETGPPRFYAFVGDQGPSAVPLAEQSDEIPFSLQEAVGLGEAETGPSLIFYALGLGLSPRIVSASLTTPTGNAIPIRTADSTTMYEGSQVLFGNAGAIIPVSPLAGNTSYTASILWESKEDTQATQTISFTTQAHCVFYECAEASRNSSPSTTEPQRPHLRIASIRRAGRTLHLSIVASPAFIGQHVDVTLQTLTHCKIAYKADCRANHASRQTFSTILHSHTLDLHRVAASASEVTISVPAFTQAGVHYTAASATAAI